MSVATAIIKTQQTKEKEMENKIERYTFSGFSFGQENYYNLSVRVLNNAGYGTSFTTQIDLELTEQERLALITLLINAKPLEKN